jgi:hypothetical protein
VVPSSWQHPGPITVASDKDTPDGSPPGVGDLSEADPSFGFGSGRQLVYAPQLPKTVKTLPAGDPKSWVDDNGKPMQALFYPPATLSASEILDNGADAVSDSDVLTDLPASSASNHALVWQGSFGLSPVLRAVPRSTEETEKSDDFLSGVALATGAAGLVAFVQEAPDQLQLRRKRDATDNDVEASNLTALGAASRHPRRRSRRRRAMQWLTAIGMAFFIGYAQRKFRGQKP